MNIAASIQDDYCTWTAEKRVCMYFYSNICAIVKTTLHKLFEYCREKESIQ